MPILTKPCEGKLSDEVLVVLKAGKNRADWGLYACETCGKSVGVVIENGKWVAEKHWPSVRYIARKPTVSRYAGRAVVETESRTLADQSKD